jgi:hypothetical protein
MNYAKNTWLTQSSPWGLFTGGAALCPDGVTRRLKRISATADTLFSIPASVTVKGRTVAGFVTVQTIEGFSTPTTSDPYVVRFFPYKNRKNAFLFQE